jgi:cystatin-A/B
MMGGFGEEKPVTDEVRTMCETMKSNIQDHVGKSFDTWEPVSFKTQVVAGTNYNVKVKVGDNEYIHVKLFKALPCNGGNVSLSSATAGHSETDTL